MKPLFVILVSYKRLNNLKRTIASLMPTTPRGSKLVVIDNCSDGETIDYLSSLIGVKVLLLDRNEGWGAAVNEGLHVNPDWTEYEYVLETNNDVDYHPGWFEKAKGYMEAHPEIGILGLWKHPHHGPRQKLEDGLIVKDDMPATSWLFRSKDLQAFLPFPEKGPTNRRGGNGEDTDFVKKVQAAGKWVCGMKEDLALHQDGYDLPDLGKVNPAYL